MITLFGRSDKPAHSSRPQMAIVMSDQGINTHRGEPEWVGVAQPDYQRRNSYWHMVQVEGSERVCSKGQSVSTAAAQIATEVEGDRSA